MKDYLDNLSNKALDLNDLKNINLEGLEPLDFEYVSLDLNYQPLDLRLEPMELKIEPLELNFKPINLSLELGGID